MIQQEYKSREYCKSIQCRIYSLPVAEREMKCGVCDAYLFHAWLQKQGFQIVKDVKCDECGSLLVEKIDCPMSCSGCSCHLNPPCSHCTEGHKKIKCQKCGNIQDAE